MVAICGNVGFWQTKLTSDFIFWGSKITADGDGSHEIKRRLLLGRKVMTNLDSILKCRDIANKGPSSQGYGFSIGHVWMWELDCEESWVLQNWCFWTALLEKTLESPLDCKEIQPVHSKGDQSWVFFGRNDAKAETPILWPSHATSWLIGKDSDAGRDWGQEEKGTTEDELAGWHHRLNGHESEWTPGVGDGQGGLACCDSWGRKESDTTERLNWAELPLLPFSDLQSSGAIHIIGTLGCISGLTFVTVLIWFWSFLALSCSLNLNSSCLVQWTNVQILAPLLNSPMSRIITSLTLSLFLYKQR